MVEPEYRLKISKQHKRQLASKVVVSFSVFVLLLCFFDADIVHAPTWSVHVEHTTIANPLFDLNMTATSDFEQGVPGSDVLFSFELRNLGTTNDTIDFQVEDDLGWNIEVEPMLLSLEIEETSKATVRVEIPDDALIGQTNIITIQAVSSGDPAVSPKTCFSVEVVTPFWEIPNIRFIIGYLVGFFVGITLTCSVIFRRTQMIHKGNLGETGNV